jgi:hypothetical protein
MEDVDYDYYKELYSYAYFSPSIREAPPYGWTREEWKKEKHRRGNPTMFDKLISRLIENGKQKAEK